MLVMSDDGDLRAPGAAVTVELCGRWEHDGPCPLAPHHSRAERSGRDVRLRVLFATETDNEGEVRARIDHALAAGHFQGTDGNTVVWQLTRSAPSSIEPGEVEHARRLVAAFA